jgi:hypothetical protein
MALPFSFYTGKIYFGGCITARYARVHNKELAEKSLTCYMQCLGIACYGVKGSCQSLVFTGFSK